MPRKVKLLGIQMQSVFNDKVANYQKISKALAKNVDFEPDLVLLPEMFNTGYDSKNFEKNAEPVPADATSMLLSGLAEKYHTNIAGSMLERSFDGSLRNTLVIFDRTGQLCAKYHKTHLFSHQGYDEGKYIEAGDKIVTVDLDFAKVGLSICYDLRFPEFYRTLALRDVGVVLCPAAWPDVRENHWVTLLKARAIENQFFVFAVNQSGKVTLSRKDAGKSMVVDPWGDVVASCGDTEEVLRAEIDLNKICEAREKIMVFKDRRTDLYEI